MTNDAWIVSTPLASYFASSLSNAIKMVLDETKVISRKGTTEYWLKRINECNTDFKNYYIMTFDEWLAKRG